MNSLPRLSLSAAVVASACAFAGASNASDLYAVDFGTPGALYTLNQTTGAISPRIGGAPGTGVNLVGDLTSNPATGTIWGIEIASATVSRLHTFDRVTGLSTGSVGVNTGPNEPLSITSIAYDSVTKTLYGNTTPTYSTTANDFLYRIDPVTGVATGIGALLGASGGPFNNVFALGFDSKGALYGITHSSGEFIAIDEATGASTLIADLDNGSYFDIAARLEDDTLFVTNTFSGAPSYSLLTITPGGVLAPVGPFPDSVNTVGLAFVEPIPEPSTYALMIAGLLGLGMIARRRSS